MTNIGVPGTIGLLLPSLTNDGRLTTTVRGHQNDIDWPEYWSDHGDDLETNTIAGGQDMIVSGSTEGDHIITIRWNEPVQVHGGTGWLLTEFDRDDKFSVELFAGATPVVEAEYEGNCNLIPVGGGINLIVPSQTGSHFVDLEEKIGSSNVHTACIVPSGGTGFWNYDMTTNEITPSTPGEGSYNLFDSELVLQRFLSKVRVFNHPTEFHVGDAKLAFPHWSWRVILHHSGGDNRLVECCFRFLLYRENSV